MVSSSGFLFYGLLGEDWCNKRIENHFAMKHLKEKTYNTKSLQPPKLHRIGLVASTRKSGLGQEGMAVGLVLPLVSIETHGKIL